MSDTRQPPLRAYLVDPVAVIEQECADPAVPQHSVALTYAFAIKAKRELGMAPAADQGGEEQHNG